MMPMPDLKVSNSCGCESTCNFISGYNKSWCTGPGVHMIRLMTGVLYFKCKQIHIPGLNTCG